MLVPRLSWYFFLLRFKNWQRYFFSILFFISLVLFWYFLFYRSLSNKLNYAIKQNNNLKNEIIGLQEKNTNQLFQKRLNALIATEILKKAESAKLQINFYEQQDSTATLRLTGSYEKIIIFLEKIQSIEIRYTCCELVRKKDMIECILTLAFLGSNEASDQSIH